MNDNGTPNVRAQGFDRLVILAYICALGMPPVGLVLAIILALRPRRASSKHVLGIIAVCLVAAAVWAVIISSGALNATNESY